MKLKVTLMVAAMVAAGVSANATSYNLAPDAATYIGGGTTDTTVAPGGSVLRVRIDNPDFLIGTADPHVVSSSYTYLHFDTSSIMTGSTFNAAHLDLLLKSPAGNNVGTITLLGVVDGALGDTTFNPATLNAANAPYKSPTIMQPSFGTGPSTVGSTAGGLTDLGNVVLANNAKDTTVSFNDPQLLTFLNDNANHSVTFIIRKSTVNDVDINTIGFSPTVIALTGDYTAPVIPEPSTYGMLAGVFCLGLYGVTSARRKAAAKA